MSRGRQSTNLSSELRLHVLSSLEADRDAWRARARQLGGNGEHELKPQSEAASEVVVENNRERAARRALQRACRIAGGQLRLAKLIKTTQPLIWYWLNKSRKGVGPRFVKRIEAATGVPSHELRPDIYPGPKTD